MTELAATSAQIIDICILAHVQEFHRVLWRHAVGRGTRGRLCVGGAVLGNCSRDAFAANSKIRAAPSNERTNRLLGCTSKARTLKKVDVEDQG